MCGYDCGYRWVVLVRASENDCVHVRCENESEDRRGDARWSGSENDHG